MDRASLVVLVALLAALPLFAAAGDLNASQQNREKWDFTTTPGMFVDSSPAVGGSLLFIGAEDKNVYALDLVTGAKKWVYKTGGAVESSPRYSNGIVYLGSNDGILYALNASNGALAWSKPLSSNVFSSPFVADGMVVVGSTGGSILAFDALTGEPRWQYETSGPVYSSPTIAAGVVYCGSNDKRLYALNATDGILLWAYETGGAIYSSPTVFNNVAYFGSYDGKVYALDAFNGSLIWMFSTGNRVVSSPTIASGTLWIGSGDGTLYAISAFSGQQRWAYEVGKPVESTPFYNSRTGVLYFGANDNHLYAVDAASGEPLWGFAAGDWITSSPIVYDGVVFFGSYDGAVYAVSTLSTIIEYPRKNQDISGQVLTIAGRSNADGGVRFVEVQFCSDPVWHTATGAVADRGFNWTYTQGIGNLLPGSYVIRARSTDASGIAEAAPYALLTVIVRKNITHANLMNVDFPVRLKRGDFVSITFTDKDGTPVPYVKVTIDGTIYYDDNGDGVVESDQSGAPIMVEQDTGEIRFTAERDGYYIDPSRRLAIQIYQEDQTGFYVAAAAGIVVAGLAVYFWRKSKEPDYT